MRKRRRRITEDRPAIITYVRITVGFDKNKFDQPRFYRRAEGKDFTETVRTLLKPFGNNALQLPQRTKLLEQINSLIEDFKSLVLPKSKPTPYNAPEGES